MRGALQAALDEAARGVVDAASIIGLGKAADLAREHIEHAGARVRALRDQLEQGILSRVPHAFATGDVDNRLPNTTSLAFEYVEGEAILLLLNQAGIAASSGSACTSGALEPSHVMRAMGIPYTAAHGTVRFSLSRENTAEQMERVIETVPSVVAKLRALSPYWEGARPRVEPSLSFAPTFA